MRKWRESPGLRALSVSVAIVASVAIAGGCGGNASSTQAASSGAGATAGSSGSATGGTAGVGAGGAGAATTGSTTTATTSTATTSATTSSGMPGSLVPGTTMLTIQAAGEERTVYLHVPQAVTSGQVPLVLALHGDGDTAQNFVTATGLAGDADAEGFVLAAPQGITRNVDVHYGGMVIQTIPGIDWDPYNAIQSDGSFTEQYNDDLPLLDALRAQLVASGSIDVHRIVVYGYSQGGYLSLRYGMSDAADISCAAVIAAGHPAPGTMLIELASRKVPVVLQIGTLDSAYSNAQQTATELMSNGHPVQLTVIQGAGHVPVPGDPKAPLDWCLQHGLP